MLGTLAGRWMQCKQKMTQDDSKEYKHSDKILGLCVCVKGAGSGTCSPITKKVLTGIDEYFSAGSARCVLCPDSCHIE